MRVPRSPATSILKPSPLRETDLPLPPHHSSSDEEESPAVGLEGLPEEKIRGLGMMLADDRAVGDERGRVYEKDVPEEEGKRVDWEEQERELKANHEPILQAEPLETPAIPVPPHNPPPISLGLPIPSGSQANAARSPSPIDELETDARFGQSDSPLPGQGRANDMDDWADEALSGFTGGKKSARFPLKGDEVGSGEETMLGGEGFDSESHEKNGTSHKARAEEPKPRGFETKGANQTRPSGWTLPESDMDEWVPPDFKGKGFQGFPEPEKVKEPEVDLEALARDLAEEKDDAPAPAEQKEGEEMTMDQLKVSTFGITDSTYGELMNVEPLL
jgi:hypothetical protein